MLKVKLMNKIAAVGTDILVGRYEVGADLVNEDAIMVRSAALHDMEFAPNLRAIARCGAGVNNIPVDKCTKEGIVVFNTPGANANAVKELVLATLILASRDIVGGISWVKTLAGQDLGRYRAWRNRRYGCKRGNFPWYERYGLRPLYHRESGLELSAFRASGGGLCGNF